MLNKSGLVNVLYLIKMTNKNGREEFWCSFLCYSRFSLWFTTTWWFGVYIESFFSFDAQTLSDIRQLFTYKSDGESCPSTDFSTWLSRCKS